MKISRRSLWIFVGILGGVIILLILLTAPSHNTQNSGSTYGRSPDGYAGWYAFMKERKTPIQRWQKPLQNLLKNQERNPITLLRIYGKPNDSLIGKNEIKWLEKGNNLVVLSVRSTVTEAPFSTQHESLGESVKIETTRREATAKQIILGDKFGAIVWQEKRGKGQLIYATTPYLAANAYKDNSGNYQFLAELIESSQPNKIFIDEYIHGYKDKEVRDTEGEKNLLNYLSETPLVPVFIQGLVILFITIWANNRRLGKALILTPTTVNNSEAYVDALAAVLQKAKSSDFIVEIVGKEEQRQIQKALGLNGNVLDVQSLIQAWVQQTGQPAIELEKLLRLQSQKRHLSEAALLDWLKKWQDIYNQFPNNRQ